MATVGAAYVDSLGSGVLTVT